MRAIAVLVAAVAALAVAGPAAASEQHPTLPELEDEVMCLVCNTTLAESSSPFADRERAIIRRDIAAGDTKSEIKSKLVDQFGKQILAAPPRSGFDLVAWWLPIAGLVGGAVVLGYGAWRWSRGRREPVGEPASVRLDPEVARRLDDELARFDA